MTPRAPRPPTSSVALRDVLDDDLPILYEHQRDPEANAMAAFPAREWDAFAAHWARILADESVVTQTILVDGQVAGSMAAFEQGGRRQVGYWVGREFWGRGVATRALATFLEHVPTRPLYAYVATHNVASRRVLEKCGFVIVEEGAGMPGPDGEEVEELLLELRA